MIEGQKLTDIEEREWRRAYAYHEAGHAVIAWALGCKVLSIRSDENGGKCLCEDSEATAERKLVICFAGPTAQRKHGLFHPSDGADDYAQAINCSITDERVRALIGETYDLVAAHWARISKRRQLCYVCRDAA